MFNMSKLADSIEYDLQETECKHLMEFPDIEDFSIKETEVEKVLTLKIMCWDCGKQYLLQCGVRKTPDRNGLS